MKRSVPTHNEIDNNLAKKICKELEIIPLRREIITLWLNLPKIRSLNNVIYD